MNVYTITAELRGWYPQNIGKEQLIWGKCYGDVKGRFRNGCTIHTSMVKEMRDCGDHFLCITLNSAYKLMKNEAAGF